MGWAARWVAHLLVNSDPVGKGWFFTMRIADASRIETLMDESAYKAMLG